MKIKYIFSMVAGLFVLVSTSCSEKKDAANATQEGKPSEAKAGPPATPVTPDKGSTISPVEAPGAYYVMLSGNGWGIGKRASMALGKLDGVKSVMLSGLRATVKMNDGAVLSDQVVTDALGRKKLTFVSKSAVTTDTPKCVYVLNVSGVGWSDTEEKARVALAKIDKVTNVYVGKKTEIWMSEDTTLDKAVITTILKGAKLELASMEKTDKSAL